MRTFAQKQNPPQARVSSSLARPNAATPGPTYREHPLLDLQPTIGNQTVLRMLRTNPEKLKPGLAGTVSPRFEHDFSRVPLHGTRAGSIQTKLAINQPGDQYEQEADRVSERVMRMPEPQLQRACAGGGGCPACQVEQPKHGHEHLQTKQVGSSDWAKIAAPPIVDEVLGSSGQPLDTSTRAFMEPRFGHDFSRVRVHSDAAAEQSARDVNAQAYTVGQNIVFGPGRFAPTTHEGQRLLAHELTHVVQQSKQAGMSTGAAAMPQVQRKRIEILDEKSSEKESESKRKAAASCPITCGKETVGTLHAMPLSYQIYAAERANTKIVNAGDPKGTGVLSAIHFIKSTKDNACACDDFEFIQVVETTHPGSKGLEDYPKSFVDVAQWTPKYRNKVGPMTPYYGEWAKSGKHVGEHPVPEGYPGAGDTVKTTQSMYDRPSRNPEKDLTDDEDFSFLAETRVVCRKERESDRILGGVTWGFSRKFNSESDRYKPIEEIPPKCLATPSKHFIETLSKGTTTGGKDTPNPETELENYDFEGKLEDDTHQRVPWVVLPRDQEQIGPRTQVAHETVPPAPDPWARPPAKTPLTKAQLEEAKKRLKKLLKHRAGR